MKDLKQIAIVGTGPGHPDYLTKRATDYINQADIILYDCLVDEIILTVIPAHVKTERIEKKYRIGNGIDIFDQQILKRMLECADKGMKVVRIKPGDSMNYNSGGMENNYLQSKGYEVELVPGIPAHFAAANIWGLNLTEIGQSNACATCILDNLEKQETQIASLAKLMKYNNMPVSYYPMNLQSLQGLVEMLKKYEICNKMPVAVCCDVSLATAKLVKTNIGDCMDILNIMANEETLPDHFIVVMGKHILQNYVDFKTQTAKTTQTCTL